MHDMAPKGVRVIQEAEEHSAVSVGQSVRLRPRQG